MRKLFISDFTLRKFVQDGAGDLLFREKTQIASCLDAIGVDQIELPPVLKAKEDRIVFQTVASLVNTRIAVPVGFEEDSVAPAWECIRAARKPCLQILLPVATAQMEYSYRVKEAAMLEKIKRLVSLAAAECETVEFSALDATRADRDFLLQTFLAARDCGASRITLCDDTGTALPEDIAELVKTVRSSCGLPLLVSLSDRIGLGQACAYAAVAAGADGVKTAMTGKDVLLTERLAGMLSACAERLDVTTGLNATELHRDISQVLQHTRQDTPAAVSAPSSSDVFLDADSTLSDVCEAVKALGYTLSDEDNGKVHKALQQVCRKKNSLSGKELEALIASNAMQAPSTYHLVSFSANCTNVGAAMAQVTLTRAEDTLLGVATGDGPIDAAFHAIEQCIGYHYELDDFQIQAVTEGREALGSALVRLRSSGRLYVGNGLSADIVGASIRAYINALNKIVFEEQ